MGPCFWVRAWAWDNQIRYQTELLLNYETLSKALNDSLSFLICKMTIVTLCNENTSLIGWWESTRDSAHNAVQKYFWTLIWKWSLLYYWVYILLNWLRHHGQITKSFKASVLSFFKWTHQTGLTVSFRFWKAVKNCPKCWNNPKIYWKGNMQIIFQTCFSSLRLSWGGVWQNSSFAAQNTYVLHWSS